MYQLQHACVCLGEGMRCGLWARRQGVARVHMCVDIEKMFFVSGKQTCVGSGASALLLFGVPLQRFTSVVHCTAAAAAVLLTRTDVTWLAAEATLLCSTPLPCPPPCQVMC